MTIIVFLVFLGFYCCYFGSQRATLYPNNAFERYLKNNRNFSKYTGFTILLVTLIFAIIQIGFASGIFTFIVSLIVCGSLTNLLAPLKIVNLNSAFFILTFLAVIEFSNII